MTKHQTSTVAGLQTHLLSRTQERLTNFQHHHASVVIIMDDGESISSFRTSCYGSTTLFLLLSNKFYEQQPIYMYCTVCTVLHFYSQI